MYSVDAVNRRLSGENAAVCGSRHLTTVQRITITTKEGPILLLMTSYLVIVYLGLRGDPILHCKKGISSTVHRVHAEWYINTAAFAIELTDVQNIT